MLLAADLGYLQRPAAAVASMKSKLLKHLMPFYRNFHDGLSDLRRAQISILTWLSKSPAKRTKRTSKTQDLSRVTWSSWCKHLNPGINLAKVHTWRTWSMNRSLNWSINESSGRPFIGHVWKFGKKMFENSCQLKSLSAYQWASLLCVHTIHYGLENLKAPGIRGAFSASLEVLLRPSKGCFLNVSAFERFFFYKVVLPCSPRQPHKV